MNVLIERSAAYAATNFHGSVIDGRYLIAPTAQTPTIVEYSMHSRGVLMVLSTETVPNCLLDFDGHVILVVGLFKFDDRQWKISPIQADFPTA